MALEDKKLLLVSDFVGVGKVALSMMIPIVNNMKADVSYMPTSVISNNFDYGKVHLHDLTEYMEKSTEVWMDLGLEFDIISTGIVMNTDQVDIINRYIEHQEKKPLVITDPIMGDMGQVYPGLDPNIVKASRKMVLSADIIIPNLTEFSLIVGYDYPKDKADHYELVKWLEKARTRGVKSAIITSVETDEGHFVYGYEKDGEIFRVEYDHVPIEIGGAGDVFTSLIIGKYAQTPDLKECVQYATEVLSHIIQKEYEAGRDGLSEEIHIQHYLNYIYSSMVE